MMISKHDELDNASGVELKTPRFMLPYTMETEWTAYLMLSIMALPFAVMFAWGVYQRPALATSFLVPIGFMALLFGYAYFSFRANKITLHGDGLSYRTLRTKERYLKYADITDMTVSIGDHSSGNKSHYQLNVHTAASEPLRIDMKPYSKQDLAMFFAVISEMNPAVELDDTCTQLCSGNNDQMIATGMKRRVQYGIQYLLLKLLLLILLGLLVKLFFR